MRFSTKNTKLKVIMATYVSMPQIASYIIALKEKYGFNTLAIKVIATKGKHESRYEFYDIGCNDELREFFRYKSAYQIEDEIYATPFHPFKLKTDDGGFSIITRPDNTERNKDDGNLKMV